MVVGSLKMAIIEPEKCIVEDVEVLSFENEEEMKFYTIWHETLLERERGFGDTLAASGRNQRQSKKVERPSIVKPVVKQAEKPEPKSSPKSTPKPVAKSVLKPTPSKPTPSPAASSPAALAPSNLPANPTATPKRMPHGYAIINSSHRTVMRYKLTKLYNKYRGRQVRRNFVNEKQRNARIDLEISKSYLNSWLAYTALQALRLPESNQHSLTSATPGKILTPLPQIQHRALNKSAKKQQQDTPKSKLQYKTSAPLTSTPQNQKPPMHLVYIDPGNIITYSNRINPQQVADYRRKSHLLPSSATSKKSSAASYDVYEIMEVLANSNKTHVTITRNANRPSQAGSNTSIYSHSVNASTPGIVSTQLHLQAKSYLDIMNKFYAEEFVRLENEREEMKHEPSEEEMIRKYIKLDLPDKERNEVKIVNNCSESFDVENNSNQNDEKLDIKSEDLLESYEDDIKSMLGNYNNNQTMDSPITIN